MWFVRAEQEMSVAGLNQKVKAAIRQSPFFHKLFKHYGVYLRDVWEVKFSVDSLQGQYAFSKGNDIKLDKKLLQCPFEDIMHFVAHEISHWLTRKREEKHYFSDPEEIMGFEWAMAYEISRGRTIDDLERTFMPMIQKQMHGDDANKTFLHMVSKAQKMAH